MQKAFVLAYFSKSTCNYYSIAFTKRLTKRSRPCIEILGNLCLGCGSQSLGLDPDNGNEPMLRHVDQRQPNVETCVGNAVQVRSCVL